MFLLEFYLVLIIVLIVCSCPLPSLSLLSSALSTLPLLFPPFSFSLFFATRPLFIIFSSKIKRWMDWEINLYTSKLAVSVRCLTKQAWNITEKLSNYFMSMTLLSQIFNVKCITNGLYIHDDRHIRIQPLLIILSIDLLLTLV